MDLDFATPTSAMPLFRVHCPVESTIARIVLDVDISSSCYLHTHNLSVSKIGGSLQSSPSIHVLDIEISSLLHQLSTQLQLTSLSRQ